MTDRQTDGRAIAYSALSMLSRAKNVKESAAVEFEPTSQKKFVSRVLNQRLRPLGHTRIGRKGLMASFIKNLVTVKFCMLS